MIVTHLLNQTLSQIRQQAVILALVLNHLLTTIHRAAASRTRQRWMTMIQRLTLTFTRTLRSMIVTCRTTTLAKTG